MGMGPCLGCFGPATSASSYSGLRRWRWSEACLVLMLKLGSVSVTLRCAIYETRGQGWSDLTHEMKRFALAEPSVSLTASGGLSWRAARKPCAPRD